MHHRSETGRTPPDRYTLKPGASSKSLPRTGPLTPAIKAQLNPADYTTRRWDSFIQKRIIMVCRAFEKRHGLRELRTPEQSQKARLAGESRPVDPKKAKYNERTGARCLLDVAPVLRDALSKPTWQARQAALAQHGVKLEPFYRPKKDPNVDPPSGLRLVDVRDSKNNIAASALDIDGVGYGLKALQDRTIADTLSLRECLEAIRSPTPTGSATLPRSAEDEMRRAYAVARAEHRQLRARNSAVRRRLVAKHREEARRLSAALKLERQMFVHDLPAANRSVAREIFAATVTQPRRLELKDRQSGERKALTIPALGTWTEWRARQEAVLPLPAKTLIEVATSEPRRASTPLISPADRFAGRIDPTSDDVAPVPIASDVVRSGPSADDPDRSLAYALANLKRGRGR
ncbi:hypothetical protein [Glacieibacterium frigidum]|uniref:Uncharacterized protein n=1 Tax=Glacieibacterium frigidum TaxID=2593303 RepID=A0A552UHN2_9SPHN|nr:hypothetical protein [Glacieibacterium frigidum]TRW17734.1 hypothetical protein FMM06_06250 [Glacieibacterium frigidum]